MWETDKNLIFILFTEMATARLLRGCGPKSPVFAFLGFAVAISSMYFTLHFLKCIPSGEGRLNTICNLEMYVTINCMFHIFSKN